MSTDGRASVSKDKMEAAMGVGQDRMYDRGAKGLVSVAMVRATSKDVT